MAEFKVGDKVKVIVNNHSFYKKGETFVVKSVDVDGDVYDENGICAGSNRIKLVDSKPTKKQRITVLEETVATLTEQLQALQQQVNERFEPSTVVVAVDGDTASLAKVIEETSVKTANELRAEIIEKAKWFVKEHSCGVYYQIPSVSKSLSETADIYFGLTEKLDFEVNEPKRTIVALSRCCSDGEVHHRGIAKCHPDDVFNVDIGKAIALGKMLQLDVSEFENAVQPTEWVVGMGLRGTDFMGEHFYFDAITKITNDDEFGTRLWCKSSFATKNAKERVGQNCEDPIITDDTNAQYEVK